jgi:hypothetical protein
VKVSVRLIGDGLSRAGPLVNDVRRRAIESLETRIAKEREARRRERDARPPTKPAAR